MNEMVENVLYGIKLNKEYLENPKAVWVITAANNQSVLDGISRGLCQMDDIVVIGGVTCPDNVLTPFGAVLAYLTGAMVVCNDIITEPECISKTYKTTGANLPDVITDDFVCLDLHLDMESVTKISGELQEDLEETIALIVSNNKQLPFHLNEMFIKPNISVEELENKIKENSKYLEQLSNIEG